MKNPIPVILFTISVLLQFYTATSFADILSVQDSSYSRDSLNYSKNGTNITDDSAYQSVLSLSGHDSIQDTIKKATETDSSKKTEPENNPSETDLWDTVSDTGYIFNRSPWGYIFTKEQLARTDAATITELLRFLPGFTIQRNNFFAGAEEIIWHGLRINGITVIVDGVPYLTRDLNWHQIPRWSPASFKRISVSTFSKNRQGRYLLIDLQSRQCSNSHPVTDAFWVSGPFNTNLLDVFFSRKLSRKLSFFLHSRVLSIESKKYTQPDVITTFYESMGKDSLHIVKTGYNPMQSFRELRAGFKRKIKNNGEVYGTYSSINEADSVFLFSNDTSLSFLSKKSTQINWIESEHSSGFATLGIRNMHLAGGNWAASFYRTRNRENGIRVSNNFTVKTNRIEIGAEKKYDEQNNDFSSPLLLWTGLSCNWKIMEYTSLYTFTRPAGGNYFAFSAKNKIGIYYNPVFVESSVSYRTSLPLINTSFSGIPVGYIKLAPDTTFKHTSRTGLRWKGYCLWVQYSKRYKSAEPIIILNNLYNLPANESFTLGLYTFEKQMLQFGSESIFTNSNPQFRQHFWGQLRRKTAGGHLQYEALIFADYVSERYIPDFKQNTLIKTEPFWDVSLKMAIKIKDFRLFYRIDNLLDSRRKYYEPYTLPGLNFLWGIHWMLKS